MEITGTFIQQFETKTGTGQKGNWEATSFMIEVPGQYPKKPIFELFNNQDAIEGLKPGDSITVHFDLDSSEWHGKHYPKVKAFKVVRGQPAQQQTTFTEPAASSQVVDDGLPF